MRKVCAALVDDLCLPVPAEPDELFTALSAKMSQLRGRCVRQIQVAFPPDSVTGLWVATNTTDYVLCELHTSLPHQLRIFFHEFWHVYRGEHAASDLGGLFADDTAANELLPPIGDEGLARIVAARSPCRAEEERDAELFAWYLAARVSRWVPVKEWTVPEHAAEVVGRLEAVLAYKRGDRLWTKPAPDITS